MHHKIGNAANRTGLRYGRLVVVTSAGRNEKGHVLWHCVCDCGRAVTKSAKTLSGCAQRNTGCGCLWKTKNNKAGSPAHVSWRSMLLRCYDPRCGSYVRYGAVGVAVRPEWHDFAAFYRDMGDPPPGYTLDRLKSDQDYSKENCRWASLVDQAANRSNTIHITANGKTQTLAAWSRELGIARTTLWARYAKGCTAEQIVAPLLGKAPHVHPIAEIKSGPENPEDLDDDR